MVLAVTHSTVVVVADDGTSPVGTDEWNDDHALSGTLPIANGGTGQATLAAADIALLSVEDQVLAGGARVTSKSLSTGNITIDPGDRPLQYITNGGAFTLTAPANDGSCMVLVTNNGSAGAITFSGFTVGSSVGDALTTTNGEKFTISIWRINSVSGYRVAAHQ